MWDDFKMYEEPRGCRIHALEEILGVECFGLTRFRFESDTQKSEFHAKTDGRTVENKKEKIIYGLDKPKKPKESTGANESANVLDQYFKKKDLTKPKEDSSQKKKKMDK